MAQTKRSDPQRAADLELISRLSLQGKTTTEISVEVSGQRPYSISRQQVDYDLRDLKRLWLHEATSTFDEIKARELARIDVVEREAWAAYYRSIGTREKTVTTRTEGESAYSRAEVHRETGLGDPRWLSVVQECIDKRLKIGGIYASDKMQDEWQKEILAMLKDGKITIEEVQATLGTELYQQFFKSSGLVIVQAGATAGEVERRADGGQ